MRIMCPVSVGEVLDKISILRIKEERIRDETKLVHIREELAQLTKACGDLTPFEEDLHLLDMCNSVIWDVEDDLRAKEKRKEFDEEFIRLARTAYTTNDRRFMVKQQVNARVNSEIQEQKSHE